MPESEPDFKPKITIYYYSKNLNNNFYKNPKIRQIFYKF